MARSSINFLSLPDKGTAGENRRLLLALGRAGRWLVRVMRFWAQRRAGAGPEGRVEDWRVAFLASLEQAAVSGRRVQVADNAIDDALADSAWRSARRCTDGACYTRTMFDSYLARWQLIADGAPIVTHASHLLPVIHRGEPAMLKIATMPDERAGAAVMRWWDGEGAARVLAFDEIAIVIERATGTLSLADMARGNEDNEATRILCAAARRLHMPRGHPPAGLVTLADWFRELPAAAESHGGILARCWDAARGLLADPRDPVVLHGDLHHDNVLDFGPRGWLAIDPKCLIGERGFDYANIFTNPDLADPMRPVAIQPGIFARRLEIVTAESGIDRQRLLHWILAWCGLSAAWYLSDGDPAFTDLRIAELAAVELDRVI